MSTFPLRSVPGDTKITFLDPVGDSLWAKQQKEILCYMAKAKVGKSYIVSTTQKKIQRGDLMVWEPEGKPGLWVVTDVSAWRDPTDLNPTDFKSAFNATTKAMSNEICDEIDQQILEELGVKVIRKDVPRGKVRLKWLAGAGGYANNKGAVIVRIEEVRHPAEMEAIAIAASGE